MPKPEENVLTVVDLEQGFKLLLGGKAPAEIVEELALSPPQFVTYVKSRMAEINQRDLAQQKGFLIGRLEALLSSVWDMRAEDPKWAMVVLKILDQERQIVFAQAMPGGGIPGAKLGDIIDMDHVGGVVRTMKERRENRAKKAPPGDD